MTMTDERVDLSDLDLLDDEHHHARCTFCTPGGEGVPFIALCGTRAILFDLSHDPLIPPPNACPKCKSVWDKPCRRCGRT